MDSPEQLSKRPRLDDTAHSDDGPSDDGLNAMNDEEIEALELVYSSEGDEEDEESDGDPLEPWQEEIVEEIMKALEYAPDQLNSESGEPLMTLAKQEQTAIRNDLWKCGPLKFMLKYSGPTAVEKPGRVLAALGLRLPVRIVDKYSDEQLEGFVQGAVRHALSSRQRLPYPHTLDEFCDVLGKAKNVIVLTGAGISTSLGIPDFRSSSGLYNMLSHLGLNDPQEVFDIHLFREDPSVFYSIAGEILPSTERFSPTHGFIKLLQDKGVLLRNYTQNIDNLESYAGIDSDKLVQCHGSFATATCITCGHKVPGESIFAEIRSATVPKCPVCAERKPIRKPLKGSDEEEEDEDPSWGVLKPDITFFGEALPKRFEELLLGGDSDACDLLICIGTSLKVAPVSEIVRILPPHVPQVYISKTAVNHNEFDITFLGNCDDAVELIADKMGWDFEHDMAQRHLHVTSDLTFPGGEIRFNDEEALYRFVYDKTEEEGEETEEADKTDDEAEEGVGKAENEELGQKTEEGTREEIDNSSAGEKPADTLQNAEPILKVEAPISEPTEIAKVQTTVDEVEVVVQTNV